MITQPEAEQLANEHNIAEIEIDEIIRLAANKGEYHVDLTGKEAELARSICYKLMKLGYAMSSCDSDMTTCISWR